MQNPKIKALIAVMGGALAAFVIIMFVEASTSMVVPPPQGLDFYNEESVTAFMQSAPFYMYLIILIGYILGAFVGGWVTNYLARGSGYYPALITGVTLMVMGILNMITIWHPIWFWVVSIPSYLVFAWLGGQKGKA